MSDRRLLESVADAVAAGEAVDWSDVERAASKGRDAGLLQQLRVVSAIGAHRCRRAAKGPTSWTRAVEAGVVLVLAIAVVRLVLALSSASAPTCPMAWPRVVNALLFGAGGIALLAGGRRDRRLQLLGGLFLAISSAFVTVLMPSAGACFDGAVVSALRAFQPEAFLALMLWRFVQGFPVETQRPTENRISRTFVNVSLGVGAVLFTASAVGGWGHGTMPAWLVALLDLFSRDDSWSTYWPLLLAVAAPAVPFLLWKARVEAHEERRRVMLFVGALALGLTPFVLAVIATPFLPVLREPTVHQRVGVVLYVALASVVPITAYSVAVNRVMDLQFVIGTTLKYALARNAVWLLSIGPIAYVGFDIYTNQQLTIAQYFERSRPVGPLALSGAGLITLTLRQHLLRAIDRWFLLEPLEQSQTLARLWRRCRKERGLRGVTEAVAAELGRVLRAPVAVLLVNDDGTELVPVKGTAGPIRRDSTLVEAVRSTRGDVPLDAQMLGAIGRLLLPADRAWLRDAGVQLLSPLIGSTGMLFGLVSIGAAKSGLPYSAAHFALVTAVCGRAAVEIENRRLRGREADRSGQSSAYVNQGLDWQDEPAAQCPDCGLVWRSETCRCSCGTPTVAAALPLFIHGKFRLERLVGAGGMGVVYVAVDMVLDRRVAVKTLPSLRSEFSERMHREARTMAKVLHPHLALIYGTEEWRGTPMLIVEYLNGGTLRDRIGRDPLSYDTAIDLGIVLADVLEHVHGAGVLHRDVKPSNIGYTADGRPKLLDFGLALLDGGPEVANHRPTVEPLSTDQVREALGRSTDPDATVTVADRLVGTPLYMAPEALAGVAPQPSFDLWGLALVLYEALAGRHPFAGLNSAAVLAAVERARVPDIRDYRPTCPDGVAALLHDALSPIVAHRPASAGALRCQLNRVRAAIPHHAH